MSNRSRKPSRTKLLQAIAASELFADLDDEVQQLLVDDIQWSRLDADEQLFRRGDAVDAMYIVIHGQLEARIAGESGKEVAAGVIPAGKPVGEMQILSGGKRNATVVATEPSELVRVSQQTVDRLAAAHPRALEHVADIVRQRLRRNQLVGILPSLFGPLDPEQLEVIEDRLQWVHVAREQVLFRNGDPSDGLYLVVAGRLQASVQNTGQDRRILGEVDRGEAVGEMGVLTGEARSATVAAVRDSWLVKMDNATFEELATVYPNLALAISRTVVRRMHRQIRATPYTEAPVHLVALIGAGPHAPVAEIGERLAAELAAFGATLQLSSRTVGRLSGVPGCEKAVPGELDDLKLSSWLDQQEGRYRFVVFLADEQVTPWSRRCVRAADQVIIVGHTDDDPEVAEAEQALLASEDAPKLTQRLLALVHSPGTPLPRNTRRWLDGRQVARHHHIRAERDADVARLARFVAGRAVGLVLGGGGVRGFAHIGVLRALREAGITVDCVGGVSIGSIVGAQVALERNYEEIIRTTGEITVGSVDYTFPVISMASGRRLTRRLARAFPLDLEDLWLPYFCVASNLSRASIVVHERGPVEVTVASSCSPPGVAPPIVVEGDLLVDGFVLNNTPIDVMKRFNAAGPVVAVEVTPPEDLEPQRSYGNRGLSGWRVLWSRLNLAAKPIELPGLLETIIRSSELYSIHHRKEIGRIADLYIRPPVEQFDIFDFELGPEVAALGYRHGSRVVRAWLRHHDPVTLQTR